ncbi:hypothetical protein HPP92_009652 [Vanilla planifolia]|uniref:PHD finger protein ALFIN-LIKE n=1 Tax=Vanilla planifolia TaxID=51239 RepID=A0A835V5N0_VANPL|nr:hypothetical protein HPP92_009652 [Vanilla planifolia]
MQGKHHSSSLFAAISSLPLLKLSCSQPVSELQTNKYTKLQLQEEEDDYLDEEEDEHADALCGACGENYGSGEFWICCDVCERWFHGKCVKITPARAEHIKQYKCPSCSSNKRARLS